MTTRIETLALLLLVVLAGVAPAQQRRSGPVPDNPRPSHKPVNTGLADDRSPEQRLRDRLSPFLKQEEDKEFNARLQALARKLLDDEKFLDSVKANLKNLKPGEIEQLKEQFGRQGQKALENPAFAKVLEEGRKKGKLKEEDLKFVQRFKTKLGENGGLGNTIKGAINNPDSPAGRFEGTQRPSQAPSQPESSQSMPNPRPGDSPTWDGLGQDTPEWMKKGLDRAMDDLGNWVESPAGKSWANSLKDMAQRAVEARNSAPSVSPRLRSFSRYLPNIRGWLPRRSPSLPSAQMPSVPRVTGRLPGVPSMPNVSARGAGEVVLVGVAVAVIALLLWYSRGWWQEALAARLAAWKLGPWPIRPGEISTRRDLVRAFEYLALLCLGPAARTCHHLELAQRIGAQPALDPDRRRDAAQDLAHVYEQARYTPDDEALPVELLSRARRELCYLAGEPAA